MILTDKQLQEIEQCGKCQFTIQKTAIIIEVDEKEFATEMSDNNSAAYKAHYKGRLLAEYEVRKSIYELATRNSSQAQELFLRLRNELKIDEAS